MKHKLTRIIYDYLLDTNKSFNSTTTCRWCCPLYMLHLIARLIFEGKSLVLQCNWWNQRFHKLQQKEAPSYHIYEFLPDSEWKRNKCNEISQKEARNPGRMAKLIKNIQLPWQDYQCHGHHSKIHAHDVHVHLCLINRLNENGEIWIPELSKNYSTGLQVNHIE